MQEQYDLIIIGGGQAGLAAAYYAKLSDTKYLVLEESSEVGSSWRNRYDSLVLFTPRIYSSLPGRNMPGDPDGYPTKDEVAQYLSNYAKHFDLYIEFDQRVTALKKVSEHFIVSTRNSNYHSRAVIVATGPFQKPRIPSWAKPMQDVVQLHSSEYKNPTNVIGNDVLVIGGGNSGAQIAEELAKNHVVSWAVNTQPRFMPAKILSKSLFWWLDKLGALNAPINSFKAKKLRARGDPVIGGHLKGMIRKGAIKIKPEATGMQNGMVTFKNGSVEQYSTIVYSTGYTLDYSWIDIPGALDNNGLPLQSEGMAQNVLGLYLIGLGWLRSRNSALLGGVGRDAEAIVKDL